MARLRHTASRLNGSPCQISITFATSSGTEYREIPSLFSPRYSISRTPDIRCGKRSRIFQAKVSRTSIELRLVSHEFRWRRDCEGSRLLTVALPLLAVFYCRHDGMPINSLRCHLDTIPVGFRVGARGGTEPTPAVCATARYRVSAMKSSTTSLFRMYSGRL